MSDPDDLVSDAFYQLEEIVDGDDYQELVEDITLPGDSVTPDAVSFGERAILYLQVQGRNGKKRYVIGEYRQGDEEIGPVPLREEELEHTLNGAGSVEIREDLLEPREINYRGQTEYISK